MPAIPSIQSLTGAHSGGTAIAVDWVRTRAFELSSTNLSRYGLTTGLEEVYAPLTDMGGAGQSGVAAYIGLAASGDVFISTSGSLYNGAAMHVSGDDLTMMDLIGYPAPNFGQGGMVGITYGSAQFCIDKGVGDIIISVLNRINEISETAWLDEQDFEGVGGKVCAGPVGTGVAYVMSPVGGSSPIYVNKIQFNGAGFASNTNVGSIAITDVDAGWNDQFTISGICLDQTDGMILAVFGGAGNSNKAYLAKVDPSDASIVWKSVIPATHGGGGVSVGQHFAYSDIRNQRMAFYTGSPNQVKIYDTSDGSVVSTLSSNLDGLSNLGDQCYNDTLGCIVIRTDFIEGGNPPAFLNSTPPSFSGWAVLYVAAGVAPTPGNGNRRWLACVRPTQAPAF